MGWINTANEMLSGAFRGSRLGGGPGWVGYGEGQWAPGANILAPERKGILGRLADVEGQRRLSGLENAPAEVLRNPGYYDESKAKAFDMRLQSPNNLLQMILGSIAQTPGPYWMGQSGEYPQRGSASGGLMLGLESLLPGKEPTPGRDPGGNWIFNQPTPVWAGGRPYIDRHDRYQEFLQGR